MEEIPFAHAARSNPTGDIWNCAPKAIINMCRYGACKYVSCGTARTVHAPDVFLVIGIRIKIYQRILIIVCYSIDCKLYNCLFVKPVPIAKDASPPQRRV
ncbi:16256_t:CDS:2 [Entrophospora sp. SA101]|nr:16256_t:CDS:2 [Entrophospora sp. SA101]